MKENPHIEMGKDREADRIEAAARYRQFAVENYPSIGKETMLGLFGGEVLKIEAEHEALQKERLDNAPKPVPLESNAPPKPKFDKAAYQLEYMKKRRAEEKRKKDAAKNT